VERVSAETNSGGSLHMSFKEMLQAGNNAADPRDFELPDDSAFEESRPITWVEGQDLICNEAAWLPLDLAVSPPRERVLMDVDTNGLAAGNTHLEAVVHGLCEVIERDALGQHLFVAMFGDPGEPGPLSRRIHLSSLPDSAQPWLDRITESGQSIEISCITTEVHIPVFRAVLIDHEFPASGRFETRRFVGFGASPNAELAVLRSSTEAVQSRIAIVLGARDSFNSVTAPPRFSHPGAATSDISASQRDHFDQVYSFTSDDLCEDFGYLLDRLREAGIGSAFVVDLTRPGLDMPVVRVRIPGLTSFLANRRRAGWRCKRHLL
jgi:ribosomal protein S12 methylthiotransferase accessory factor